jgi:hypothetical protein
MMSIKVGCCGFPNIAVYDALRFMELVRSRHGVKIF